MRRLGRSIPPEPAVDPDGWCGPPWPDGVEAKTIGISLSGGGYRATLFAVGALAAVYDSGYWSGVRWIASVSGGSFASAAVALLPLHPSADDIDGFVGRAIAVASRRLSLAARPTHGVGIGAAFEAGIASAWLRCGADAQPTLSSIQRDDRLHAFMAVDLHSLEPVALTDRIVHTVGGEDEDHVAHDPGPLRLAKAVRASASVPLLPAVRIRPADLGSGGDFPLTRDLFLGDGGNWNNLGTNWEKIAQWLDRRNGLLPAAIPERVDLHLVVDASARLRGPSRWRTRRRPFALDWPFMSFDRAWLASYRSTVRAHTLALRNEDGVLPSKVLLASLEEVPTGRLLSGSFLQGDDRMGWHLVAEHNQSIGTWWPTLRGLPTQSGVHLVAHGYGLVAALLVERGVDPSGFEIPHSRIARTLH